MKNSLFILVSALTAYSASGAIQVGSHPDGGEPTLASILGVTQDIIDSKQVHEDGYFIISQASVSLLFQYAGNARNNQLGVFSNGDDGRRYEGIIFGTPASTGFSKNVSFGDGTVTIDGRTAPFAMGAQKKVGFFLRNTVNDNGFQYYSDPSLNSDSKSAHVVTYNGSDVSRTETWIMGWEDKTIGEIGADLRGKLGSDRDYQDLIVGVTAVPEPATYLSGIGSLFFFVLTMAAKRK